MNISSRCEYACRAAIELAQNGPNADPLSATTIAERRTIPEQYLVHILLQLKRASLVRSVRGARGGYLLARPPEEISLRDIVTAIDGPLLDPLPVGGAGSEELTPALQNAAAAVGDVLAELTLRSLLRDAPKTDMYFI